MNLTRNDLLSFRPRRTEEVETPELGGNVLIRALTLKESMALWKELEAEEDQVELCATQLVAFVSEEDGSQALHSKEEAYAFMDSTCAAVVSRIIKRAERLNGLGEESVRQAEKN